MARDLGHQLFHICLQHLVHQLHSIIYSRTCYGPQHSLRSIDLTTTACTTSRNIYFVHLIYSNCTAVAQWQFNMCRNNELPIWNALAVISNNLGSEQSSCGGSPWEDDDHRQTRPSQFPRRCWNAWAHCRNSRNTRIWHGLLDSFSFTRVLLVCNVIEYVTSNAKATEFCYAIS